MPNQLPQYSAEVTRILALRGPELQPMPLAGSLPVPAEAAKLLAAPAERLFPGARAAQAAVSGLWLYFSGLEESHRISQDIAAVEGSFWHGIMHRREPDAGNSGYWFRRVGRHAVFPALLEAASGIAARYGRKTWLKHEWDPFAFIDLCEQARRKPGSEEEKMVMEIQLAEWQLLLDYCAGTGKAILET